MGRKANIFLAFSDKMPAKGKIYTGAFSIALGIIFIIISISTIMITLWFILLGIFWLIFGIALILVGVTQIKEEKEYEENLIKANIEEIDKMNGSEFESYLSALFKKIGYLVEKTPSSRDYGADLILHKEYKHIAVQTKRYVNKVSVSAIQEAKTSINYYNCTEAWVITNNFFTKPAQNLALSNNIRLIDRIELCKMIANIKKLQEDENEKIADNK